MRLLTISILVVLYFFYNMAAQAQTKKETKVFKNEFVEIDSVLFSKLYDGTSWKELYKIKGRKLLPINVGTTIKFLKDTAYFTRQLISYDCPCSFEDYVKEDRFVEEISSGFTRKIYFTCDEKYEKWFWVINKLNENYLVVDWYQRNPSESNNEAAIYYKQFRLVYSRVY